MKNGVLRIEDIKDSPITKNDLISCLLDIAGAHVSNIPRNYQSKAYSNYIEIFDPELVEDESKLPEYWKMVLNKHNEPDMGDCRTLRYRYAHIPYDILPRYPRVACKGLFQLDRDVDISKLKETDLVHIGNEFEDIK